MCKDPILPPPPNQIHQGDLNIRFNSINMVSLRQPKLFLSILLVYFHDFFLRLLLHLHLHDFTHDLQVFRFKQGLHGQVEKLSV